MSTRISAACILSGLAGLAIANTAWAIGLTWNNALGGTAGTASNWSPALAPTAADDLSFNLNATYTVTFGALADQSRTMKFKRGTVSLNVTSTHTSSAGITVGDASTDVGLMTLTAGSIITSGPVIIGNATGSAGTLRVNASSASLVTQTTSGDMTVGSNGPGTLQITGAGLVQVADTFLAGNNSAGTSSITVSGGQTAPLAHSRLLVLGTGQHRLGQGGDLTMSIASGGEANFAGDVVVANGSASTSSVTVGGSFNLANSKLLVSGDLLIGRNTTTAAAGSGTVTINNGGRLTTGGSILVGGDAQGGTGELIINDGAVITARAITDAAPNFAGGTINVTGGTLDFGPCSPISSPQGSLITLSNGSHFLFKDAQLSFTPTLGRAGGSGTIEVTSGSSLDVQSALVGGFVLGDGAGSVGILRVSGAGSSAGTNSSTFVGFGGAASLEVSASATFQTIGLAVAGTDPAAPLNANAFVTVNGGSVTSTGAIAFGGTVNGATQRASVSISGGGTIRTAPPSFGVAPSIFIHGTTAAVFVGAASLLESSGYDGTISVTAGPAAGSTPLTLAGGTIRCNRLEIDQHATFSATGEVDGNLALINPASVLALTGDLLVGQNPTVFGGLTLLPQGPSFENASTFALGSRHLTLKYANAASVLGTMSIAGGRLDAGYAVIGAGKTFSGFGTISGLIYNEGTLSCGGAGGALLIDGTLTSVGATITGSLLELAPASRMNLAGTVGCRTIVDSGASIVLSGNSTLGLGTDPAGLSLLGTLDVGSYTLTLLGPGTVTLNGELLLNTGSITCSRPITLGINALLKGRGTITTPTLRISGTLQPQAEYIFQPTIYPGPISVSGSVVLTSNARAVIDVDPTPYTYANDLLSATGTVSLGGSLLVNVTDATMDAVSEGDRWTIMTGALVQGFFDSVELPYKWELGVHPTFVEVIAHVPPVCIADFNSDGGVDSNDLESFFFAWENAIPTADVNDDGGIDSNDIDAFFAAWESGGC